MDLKLISCITCLITIMSATQAQSYPNHSALTLENIMKGEEWTGTPPSNVSWSVDGNSVLFTWNPDKDLLPSTYQWSPITRNIEKLTEKEQELTVPQKQRDFNAAHDKVIFVKNGNLYLESVPDGQNILTLDFASDISSPHFLLNEDHFSFIMNENLYLFSSASQSLKVLTDFRKGENPDHEPYTGDQDQWLHNEEMSIFEILRIRDQRDSLIEMHRTSVSPQKPKTIYTGDSKIFDISLSADENYIVYLAFTRSKNGKQVEMPDYVTESGFTEMKKIRKKVGYPYGSMKLGIYDRRRDTAYNADISMLPGIHDFPVFGDVQTWETREKDFRKVYLSPPVWSEDARKALINVKSADNKDRWITLLDLKTGALQSLDRQHDEAWLEGPDIGELTDPGTLAWYPDNQTIYFQSEESGYSHLYQLNTNTGKKKQLTKGNFEIFHPFLSLDKKSFWFTSSEEDPGVRDFYTMSAQGGRRTRLTTMTGNNEVFLSPDEQSMIILYSFANKPWELYFVKTGSDDTPQKITDSCSPEFKSYTWRVPEFIHFTASDGVSVPARLYVPDDSIKNNAAVIFVHGAGYLQNAHKWWSEYYHEYMFHNFLTDNGFTVLDIDYRGSAGYGRDWRTAVYRHMGGRDLDDNLDGAKFLSEAYGIDSGRIGIYGGSYGGFMTLMALFTSPGTFRAGAALRSVTDWAHYNHGYTSNILNTPFTDSLAYRQSSPIYFAEGLNDHLLMCHGMIDDNVHFQDIVRLTQRLIELKKDHWELAVYPLESHKFKEWSSWLDEYKRIYLLFEDTLTEKTDSPR